MWNMKVILYVSGIVFTFLFFSQGTNTNAIGTRSCDPESTNFDEDCLMNPEVLELPNGEQHHRQKRGVAAAPAEVMFTLSKKAPYTSVTTMEIGSRVTFQLEISFPSGNTDMSVELFAPDNDTNVMILCDVKIVSQGSLSFSVGTPTVDLRSKEAGSVLYDWAIIDLGQVTNNLCDTISQCTLVIEYDAVMIENAQTQNGQTYWVSAGAEYNNENNIWVGQASFVVDTTNAAVTDSPTFNLTGPSELPIGSSAIYEVEMTLPYPSSDVIFNAFAPINTSSVMTICKAEIQTVSNNFLCGWDQNDVTSQAHAATTGIGNTLVEVNLNRLTNKRSRDVGNLASDNLITMKFFAHMYSDAANVGSTYMLGAAFQLGSTQIWAGSLPVTALAAIDSSGMPFVVVDIVTDNDDIHVGVVKEVRVKVTIPGETTSKYTMNVKAPIINDKPVFHVCAIEVESVGANLPCAEKRTVTYDSRVASPTGPDTATIDIGSVSNVFPEPTDDDDIITFLVHLTPIEHPDTTLNSAHSLDVEVTYAEGRPGTASKLLNLASTTSDYVYDNSSSPTYQLTFASGSDQVEVLSSTRVLFEITSVRNVTFPMMNIELITPSSNYSSYFNVCRAQILSAGKNIPCVTPRYVNNKITYTSRFSNNLNDRAVVELPNLCNHEFASGTNEDMMVLALDIQVQDDIDLIHNQKVWISAGNQYSSSKLWVGQLALFPQRTGTVAPTTTPFVEVYKNTTIKDIPLGYPVIYSTVIKIAPMETAALKIEVASSQDGLYVCGLRVKVVGDNLPCMDVHTQPTYTDFSSGYHQTATLDLGYVTSLGSDPLVYTGFFDSNTIIVETIIKLSEDTTLVTSGSTYGFTTKVTYDTSGTNTLDTQSITATSNRSELDMTITKSASFNFTIAGMDESTTTNMYPGEAKRFILDMVIPETTTQEVMVKFMTPVLTPGYMEVCGAAVVSVGYHFPCLLKKKIEPTFTKRSGSSYKDIASMNLGFLCSSTVRPGSDIDNTIQLEAVARLLEESSLTNGQVIPFYVSVETNGQEIFVSQIDVVVTNTFTSSAGIFSANESILYVNHSDPSPTISLGIVYTLDVVVNVPPLSTSMMLFDVDATMGIVPIALVKDVRLKSTGTNIACLYKSEALGRLFSAMYNSSEDTCVLDGAVVDVGVVSNGGLSYRRDVFQDGDNSVVFEVDVRLVDSIYASNGQEISISFGTKISSYISICQWNATVNMDGSEKPDLELTAKLNETESNSTAVVIDVIVKHTNVSSADAESTMVGVYIPPYVIFSQVLYSNKTVVDVEQGLEGNSIALGKLLMCEIVELKLLLVPNDTVLVPEDILPSDSLALLEVVAQKENKPGNTYPVGTLFPTDLQPVNFSVVVGYSRSCDQPLGMESNHIDDCQILASLENDLARPASHGRLNGNSAWSPYIRSKPYSKYRYFQVYFGNRTIVTRLALQQGDGFTHYPTEIELQYSDDGMAWQIGETISIVPPFTTKVLKTANQVEGRYIRVYILKDNAPDNDVASIGLKFEFYGCYTKTDVSKDDRCANEKPVIIDYYQRSFAVAGSMLIVCDINHREMKPECFRSADGVEWKKLPDNVASLLGYDASNDNLYAYNSDQTTTMVSRDQGITFQSVERDHYYNAKKNFLFKSAKRVPWLADASLKVNEPLPEYVIDNFGATYDGVFIFQNIWRQILTWKD